jgi:hypothetical protein
MAGPDHDCARFVQYKDVVSWRNMLVHLGAEIINVAGKFRRSRHPRMDYRQSSGLLFE